MEKLIPNFATYRPPIGPAHLRLVLDIMHKVNDGALYPRSFITVLRDIIEKVWKQSFPGQELPEDVKALHVPYWKDIEL